MLEVANPSEGKPSYGAIATGLLVAGLGYAAALADGMVTARAASAGLIGLSLIILGVGLALLGTASIWMPRLRRSARLSNRGALGLLLAAFVIDRLVMAFSA
jgi:uncharacterized membrane protein YidH (DUF202 family)